METVLSPITNSPASLVKELDVSLIKKKYIEELSISIDKYLSSTGKITIYRCPNTGYRFYYPFTIFGDADFYNQLKQANKNYYEPWKWENEQALKFIKPTDFLLDVGCGEGLFLKEVKKKGMQNLYGIDFAAKEDLKNEVTGIQFKSTTIEKYSSENAEKFDVITCFQVLEHITDIKSFIGNCLLCLKPGGKLIIAVPNSHPYIYKRDIYHTLNLPPHHAGLWDKSALQKLSEHFPIKQVFATQQNIGIELGYYINTQIYYSSTGNILLKFIFQFSLFRVIYGKYLHLFKSLIQGHSQIAVYKKR